MCLEMRSLSAQAIGIDGEEYECDAELRRQKLLVLNHAAEEVETKIRARMKERVCIGVVFSSLHDPPA